MKVQSVRFGARQWDLITEAAEQEGTSAAQFIRDAAYARAVVHLHEQLTWVELAEILQNNPELRHRLELLLHRPPSDEPQALP